MSKKLFDFCCGNPPYQGNNDQNGRQPPVYHEFMDAAYEVADCVELITPARFLFNAGQTPKQWNQKMLNDEHFKVLQYESDASKVFANTEIKGGVAIHIRDKNKDFGAIQVFTSRPELNQIIQSIFSVTGSANRIDSIVSSRGNYRTTPLFFADFPFASNCLGKGTGNMIASNFFEKLPEVYDVIDAEARKGNIRFLCRINNKRTYCNLKNTYVQENVFLNKYNVACPKSNGSGIFGEVLTSTEILIPNEAATDTFISIGAFDSIHEAQALQKYIKTKFFRTMLGVKKVTQDNPKSVWDMIPLQDFSSSSDIDWSKSIHEIDLQLYRKYNLDETEITFIETNVKEMV